MPWGRSLKVFAAGLGLLAIGVQPAQAQTARSGPQLAAPPRDDHPWGKNAMGIEIAGAVMTEAWNSNGTHEWVTEGTVGVNWAFRDGQALVVQFHVARIDQATPRPAYLQAIIPNLRFRLYEKDRWTVFVEFGAGASWSDTATPPRGTRFNFLLNGSGGVTYRMTPQIHAVASARLLHLSNASIYGGNRNPDIEALGGTFGIYFGF